MFERFADRARRVLVLSQEQARLLGHSFIGTEHILLGLIDEGEGVAADALTRLDVTLDSVRAMVEGMSGMGSAPSGSPPFTPRAKKVLELSLRECLQLNDQYIDTEHMLLGLIREGEGVGAQILVSLGVNLHQLRLQVLSDLGEITAEEAMEVHKGSPLGFGPFMIFGDGQGFGRALTGLCEDGLAVQLVLRDGGRKNVVLVAVRGEELVVRKFDGTGPVGEEFSIELDTIAQVRVS